MTDAAQFVQRIFTNRDRTAGEQVAIHADALRLMDALALCPLRVNALAPHVFRFFYLFNSTFSSPRKTRGELILLCGEALRIAKRWPDKHTHNPEEWVSSVLNELIEKGMLRQVQRSRQRLIVATEAGDAAVAALEAASAAAGAQARQAGKARPKRKKYTKEEVWFPTAANLMRDGLSDAAIARRVGIAKSTLVYNKRWRNARKLFAPADKRPRHFEKRGGVRQPLPMAEEDAQDELNDELNSDSEN